MNFSAKLIELPGKANMQAKFYICIEFLIFKL
jgi:hypothetical protein